MSRLALLQLVDSAFPAGGFAHSGGLEAMAQAQIVKSGAELARVAEEVAWQAAIGAMPFMLAAHRDPAQHVVLDRRFDETLWSHVARRASCVQGRAIVDAAARSFELEALIEPRRAIAQGHAAGHFAPAFGVVGRALDIDSAALAEAFVFVSVRSVTSAAVRLGIVGPYEAQRVTFALAGAMVRAIAEGQRRNIDDVAQPALLLDLLQGTHDSLYSRLFLS